MEEWLPAFACPECREATTRDGADAVLCGRCGSRFEQRGGVYRFLSARRAEAAAAFARQYRLVREREGYRVESPDYYRALPSVDRRCPRAAEWRVRRESCEQLSRRVLSGVDRGPLRVLDLGAGNGWLSHRLAAAGHRVVAVDRLDDEADGLGACRHYGVRFAAVQADFDALPFEPEQFDVAVYDGSLHYSSDPGATLEEARRVLAPDGALVVMDSPMFFRERDGHAMVVDQLGQLASEHGLRDVVRPGIGFLTFAALELAAARLGMHARFFRSRGPLMWRARRHLAWLRLGRAPAAFGVWVAQ